MWKAVRKQQLKAPVGDDGLCDDGPGLDLSAHRAGQPIQEPGKMNDGTLRLVEEQPSVLECLRRPSEAVEDLEEPPPRT